MVEDTSMQAYLQIIPEIGERQTIVLIAIKELCYKFDDCTDQEIRRHLQKAEPNYVRPRRFELVNDIKVVIEARKRNCKVTGRLAKAWKIDQLRLDKMILKNHGVK